MRFYEPLPLSEVILSLQALVGLECGFFFFERGITARKKEKESFFLFIPPPPFFFCGMSWSRVLLCQLKRGLPVP